MRYVVLFPDPKLPQHEGVLESDVVQRIVTATFAAVAGGFHIYLENERVGIGLVSAELGDVFRWFLVHDLAVVER